VVHPQSLDEAVSSQKIVHMSAGQYHTLASSTKGSLLGFGDKWQLCKMHTICKVAKEVFTEIHCIDRSQNKLFQGFHHLERR
jgi:hypothetical protein